MTLEHMNANLGSIDVFQEHGEESIPEAGCEKG